MNLHTNQRLMIVLLIPFSVTMATLFWLSLAEYPHPIGHFLDLLEHDRVFQMVMFDFTFFFLWVIFWMIDRARKTGQAVFPWIVVGLVCATWMIYLFVATGRRVREKGPAEAGR